MARSGQLLACMVNPTGAAGNSNVASGASTARRTVACSESGTVLGHRSSMPAVTGSMQSTCPIVNAHDPTLRLSISTSRALQVCKQQALHARYQERSASCEAIVPVHMSISRAGPLLLSAGTDVAFRQRLAQAATAIANIHGSTRSTSPCSSSNEQGPPADVPRCSRQSRRQEHQPHSQWPQGSMALGCQPTIAYGARCSGARCSTLLLSQSWRPQRPPWEGINQMRLQHSSGSRGFQFDTQQQHQQQQHQHGQPLDEEM